MFKVLYDISRRDHCILLLIPTLSFEDVDVINKHSCRLLMDITLAGPKSFNAVAMLYFLYGIVTI